MAINIEEITDLFGADNEVKEIIKTNKSLVIHTTKEGEDVIIKGTSDFKYMLEVEALKQLKSLDNVPRVRDIKEKGHLTYILKDYMPGISMFKFMRTNNYFQNKQRIYEIIKEEVNKIHDMGVSFLDPHDENILILPESFKINLYDFDTALVIKSNLFNSMKKSDLKIVDLYYSPKKSLV